MAHVVKDRVQETTTTTGTGALTLGGAVTGFQTFSSAIGNTNTTYYAIQNGSEWEVGIGTVGAGTLSRDTILESSNAGAAVNLSAGTKQVFCTYPAEKSVDLDTAQTLTNKTISVDDNTVSGIAASSFVLSNASGNIDGSVAQKAIPSGVVVGTTDTQTLTNKTLDGGTVVTANSSADALRITQTGAGNAIRIEDAANPDATPTVIDQNGRVIVGGTTPYSADTVTPKIQVVTDTVFDGGFGGSSWSSDANGQITWFAKSKSGTIGTHSAVTTNDVLMDIRNYGSDGSAFAQSARIASIVDGTVASNSVPSRITFSTTAVGGTSVTERMRIDSAGNVGIGRTANVAVRFDVGGTYGTGAAESYGAFIRGTSPSTTTSNLYGIASQQSTQDAAFTLTNLRHFGVFQGTITGGSRTAPTNQVGYFVDAGLTGATNNYGFFSGIASGTGRWNFFANGTAVNFFAGNVGIGSGKTAPATALDVNGTITATGWSGGGIVTETASQTLTNKTLTEPTITGTIIEDVFPLSDAGTINVDPANGSIQYVTLGGTARILSFTSMIDGEAITLMINDGTSGSITTWNLTFVNNGGAAPTLSTSGFTVISVWKVNGTVYAAVVGNA